MQISLLIINYWRGNTFLYYRVIRWGYFVTQRRAQSHKVLSVPHERPALCGIVSGKAFLSAGFLYLTTHMSVAAHYITTIDDAERIPNKADL